MKRNRIIRVTAIVMAVVMLAILPAGCSKDEITLLSALMNTEQIRSYESEVKFGMSLNIVPNERNSGYYTQTNEMMYRLLKAYFDGMSVDMSMKVNADEDYKNIKQEMILTPTVLGGQMKDLTLGIWADFESGDLDKCDMYFKMPSILAALSKSTADKEYLTMNMGEIMKLAEEVGADVEIDLDGLSQMMDFSKIIADSVEIMEPVTAIFLKAAAEMNPDEAYVSGIRPVNGENAKRANVYTLTISDKGLKSLLRSFVNDLDKATLKEFLLTLLDCSIKYIENYSDASYIYEEMLDELESARDEIEIGFDLAYAMALPTINETLDSLDKVKILGPKGITFDIEVNSDGFVTMWDGVMDFSVDIVGLDKMIGGSGRTDIKRVDVTLKLYQKMTRINKIVKIDMPAVNMKNSISINDLILAETESYGSFPIYSEDALPEYYDDYDYYDDEYDDEVTEDILGGAAGI